MYISEKNRSIGRVIAWIKIIVAIAPAVFFVLGTVLFLYEIIINGNPTWLELLFCVIAEIPAALLLRNGFWQLRLIRECTLYAEYISANGSISLERLAQMMAQPAARIQRNIDKMIRHGYLTNVIVNRVTGCVQTASFPGRNANSV